MKKKTGKHLFSKLVVIVLAFSAVAVFASRNETVGRALNILKPEVKVLISGAVKRGDKNVSLDKAAAVKSGEIIDWKISSLNAGNASARSYRVVGEIPAGTEFIAGSAAGDKSPAVTFSIDGGNSFSAQPVVQERQADGSIKEVPAPVSMYSQVRFEWANELPADSQFKAVYRVRVK